MRLQLRAAALLVATATIPAPVTAQGPVRVAVDAFAYSDDDNVVVVSPQLTVAAALDDDGGEVSARVAVDTVSAASVDVVAHATTRFSEVRTEGTLSASRAFGDQRPSLSYRVSFEPDYRSHGVRAGLESRLGGIADSTLSVGYGVTLDAVGRTGTPFDVFHERLTTHSVDVGLTQVLGPRTVVRGVYTLTASSGYLEKPYRFVPLFDEGSLASAANDGARLDLRTFDHYRLPARVPEEVPDLRVGHAAAVRALRYVEALRGSLRLDYQLYVDSFGLIAHVLEPALRVALPGEVRFEVFGRLYRQSGASFWRRTYVVAAADRAPRWRTLDRDLSPYTSGTAGVHAEWERAPFTVYAEGALLRTRFHDHLFLDRRLALTGQVGFRWSPR